MVKGGALYYAIIILLLSSLILGSILLASYYQNVTLINKIENDRTLNLLSSSITLAAYEDFPFQNHLVKDYQVFLDDTSTVNLEIKLWGTFRVFTSHAFNFKRQYSKSALVASNPFMQERVGLYLADNGRGISISGSTRISGVCYLPDKSIRTASIEGQPYNGGELISGQIKNSQETLPPLKISLWEHANKLVGSLDDDLFSQIISPDQIPECLQVSFIDLPVLIYSQSPITLSECDLKGNIIIFSEDIIHVDGSCSTKDIILIAPAIEIGNGFKGSLQAFSDNYIKVGDNCCLELPTFLGIGNPVTGYMGNKSISVGENATIHGAIAFKDNSAQVIFELSYNSTIYGQIYCPGQVTLKGDIIGSIYCHSFYLRTGRAQYLNHLLNSRITPTELSEYFVNSGVLESNTQYTIAKWLN